MKQHPAALVPSVKAAAELRKIAASLRLIVDGENMGTAPDMSRIVKTSGVRRGFTVVLNPVNRELSIPPIVLDFFDVTYLPSQVVSGAPKTGMHRLRLVVEATCDTAEALQSQPPEAYILSIIFEWFDTQEGTLTPPDTDPAPPVQTATKYYFYICDIADGVITDNRATAYLWGGPLEVPF